MRKHWARRAPKILAVATLAVAALGFVVMALWNWLMPPLFGRPTVTFWQAVGLLVLSKLLLGGFRGRPGPPSWHWRRRMMERWEHMTPDEREKFRAGLQKGGDPFGPFGPPDAPKV
jgi:hypothetical protein